MTRGTISLRLAAGILLAALGLSQALAQPFPRGGFPGKGPGPMPPAGGFDRQVVQPQPPQRPPFERLSPEERRQLRRDIEQHGREIYPNARRQPGRR